MSDWSENMIAAALHHQLLQRKHLIVVPRCGWTGYECDLLTVTNDRRIIDFEIKISRSDLKADAKKDKWFERWNYAIDGPRTLGQQSTRARPWPNKVWKHYYVMPAEVWKPELVEILPSKASGILLLWESPVASSGIRIDLRRRATPNKDAERISVLDCLDIARLASLRMWDAYAKLEATKVRRTKVKVRE